MKQIITSITFTNPCTKQWNQLTPADGGRHCASCDKVVTDFTRMTDAEIIDYLGKNKQVCGRMYQTQMDGLNRQLHAASLQQNIFFKRLALFTALTATVPAIAKAKEKHQIVQALNKKNTTYYAPVKDSVTFITITGKVTDEGDNLPLPGVVIRTKDGKVQVVSNNEGLFIITVPANTKVLEARFIGYEVQQIKVKKNSVKNFNLKLKMNPQMLGGMGVTKPSFYKQIYYGYLKPSLQKLLG